MAPMPSITAAGKAFVSFRIGDAEEAAMLVDRCLCRLFGTDRVFRSGRAMHRGALFPPMLAAEAADCAVMVVVIGGRWLGGRGGTRRIDYPEDWVRREIEVALDNDRPVVPVLTGDRRPLGPDDDLPPSLSGLLGRPYLRFRAATPDLARIVDEVRSHLDDTARPAAPTRLVDLQPTTRSSDVRLSGGDIVCHASASLVGFNLGMRVRRLEVTAAVRADGTEPGRAGVFTVIGDGRVLAQVTATTGQPRPLRVDVTDVLNLKLTAHRDSGGTLALAWGDPMVHP